MGYSYTGPAGQVQARVQAQVQVQRHEGKGRARNMEMAGRGARPEPKPQRRFSGGREEKSLPNGDTILGSLRAPASRLWGGEWAPLDS